eukprot:s2955_g5.t1
MAALQEHPELGKGRQEALQKGKALQKGRTNKPAAAPAAVGRGPAHLQVEKGARLRQRVQSLRQKLHLHQRERALKKKKQLLAVFLKNRGDLKKSGIYHKELVGMTEVAGSLGGQTKFSTGVLVAISMLLLVNRGSIRVRKDPKDPQEWQFSLETSVACKDKLSKHEMNMEAATKMEAIEWMEARKTGSTLSPEDGLAENALNDVLPTSCKRKAKELAALCDKESEKEGDEDDDEEEDGQKKLNKAAVEADVLSDMGGSKSKDLTAKRILKMLKLVKEANADLAKCSSGSKPAAHQKQLQNCQVELQKLSKQGQKVKLEAAKDTLCEAALAVKRASKALEKK